MGVGARLKIVVPLIAVVWARLGCQHRVTRPTVISVAVVAIASVAGTIATIRARALGSHRLSVGTQGRRPNVVGMGKGSGHALRVAIGAWSAIGSGAATPAFGLFFLADAIHHFGPCRFGGGSHDFSAGGFAQATPQGLAAHGDRLGLFARLGPKALDHLHLDLLSGEMLDLFHEAFFVQ